MLYWLIAQKIVFRIAVLDLEYVKKWCDFYGRDDFANIINYYLLQPEKKSVIPTEIPIFLYRW